MSRKRKDCSLRGITLGSLQGDMQMRFTVYVVPNPIKQDSFIDRTIERYENTMNQTLCTVAVMETGNHSITGMIKGKGNR